MRHALFLILFTFFLRLCSAQDQPVYNQFYFNPFLYNPAFIANGNMLEVNLTHKTQWVENPDAPSVSAFNLQYATKGRLLLGMSYQSQNTVALESNITFVTFGYRVDLADDKFLKFGLSAGFLQNRLDLDEIARSSDPGILDDPVLFLANDNSISMASQVGLQLKLNKFTFGFALPQLLENNINSTDNFNSPSFNEFNQFITTASFDSDISPVLRLQPVLLYRHIDANQFQAEGSILATYKNLVWIGGGYRYDAGVIGHAGLNVKETLSFAYSYNHGLNDLSVLGANHEITVKLMLHRKSKAKEQNTELLGPSKLEPTQESETETQLLPEESLASEPLEDDIEEKQTPVEEELVIKVIETDDSTFTNTISAQERIIKMAKNQTGLDPGHYVIVGVFAVQSNANRLRDLAKERFNDIRVALNQVNDLYYVYVYTSPNLESARSELIEVKTQDKFDFKDAWILHIDK